MGLKILCSGYIVASGRPVVVQDTHFKTWLPTGAALFTFQNREQAIEAIEEVKRRYDFHCHAARQIAEEYFDASKVLSRLLEQAMSPELEPATASERELHVRPRNPCAYQVGEMAKNHGSHRRGTEKIRRRSNEPA